MSESEQGAAAPAPLRVLPEVTPGTVAAAVGRSVAGADATTAIAAADGPTGDQAVDQALARLVDVESEDLSTQVARFEDVHTDLQHRLADAEG